MSPPAVTPSGGNVLTINTDAILAETEQHAGDAGVEEEESVVYTPNLFSRRFAKETLPSVIKQQQQEKKHAGSISNEAPKELTHIMIKRPGGGDYFILDVKPSKEPLNDIANITKVITDPEYLRNHRNKLYCGNNATSYLPLDSSLFIDFVPFQEPKPLDASSAFSPAFLTTERYLPVSPIAKPAPGVAPGSEDKTS